ncbi:MAG: hypothetical protein Q9169_003717 [Polycauliona sp. 2 TL-2023]
MALLKHTVSNGERLWNIGIRYGVVLVDLAVENGLAEPYTINTGQVLSIPSYGRDRCVDTKDGPEKQAKLGNDHEMKPAGGKQRSAPAFFAPEDKSLQTITRFLHGRMQYRDDPMQEWIDLESALPNQDTSDHPEPINVQQVTVSDKSITIRQYKNVYNSQVKDGIKIVKVPQYGWGITIENHAITDLVLCEWEEPSWKDGMAFCSIRFKCSGPQSSSQDVSEIPTSDMQEELGWTDEAKEEMQADLLSTGGFSLAGLTKDAGTLEGKYIRLAFLKGGRRHRTVWPKVIDNLMGQSFKYSKFEDGDNLASLNTFAEKMGTRLALARLDKVLSDDKVEWHVVKKTSQVSQPSKPARPAKDEPSFPLRHPGPAVTEKRAREAGSVEDMSMQELECLLGKLTVDLQRDSVDAYNAKEAATEARRKADETTRRFVVVEEQLKKKRV